MAKPKWDVPVAVVGGGAVGLAVALALSEGGAPCALIGAVDVPREDGRTAALMQPSIALLDRLGVLGELGERRYPLAAIRLIDATDALVRAPTVTFRAAEIDLDAFAVNVSNADLVRVMTAELRRRPQVRLETGFAKGAAFHDDHVAITLADGAVITAGLAVAADGRDSPLRNAANIGARSWAYDQVALTFHVRCTRDHEDVSTEFHTRAGPLTFVPYGDYTASVVWLVRPAEARRLMALPAPALAAACQRQSASLLGDLTLTTPVGAVPMRGLIAASAAAPRLMLAGEALHVFPPVGAQGLNLGFRDAADVAAAVQAHAGDPGGAEAISAYESARRLDAVTRTLGVDLLNRSIIAGWLPADLLRGAGLAAAANIAPLRRALMRAGMGQAVA